AQQTQQTPVERFYGYRAEERARYADGFLSYGYWPEGTEDYFEAAEKLLDYFLARADIQSPGIVLNVCCGNGAETTRIHERVKPEKLYGPEIPAAHIEACRRRVEALGLSDRLVFERGDACRTGFPAGMFSHVIGIEGPAHFVTRERFFAEAHRVLEPG